MYEGRHARLVEVKPLIDLLDRAIGLSRDVALTRGLCVLRASVRTHGLGLAHTHIRLNARQLHNAIRKSIGMDHPPDDPSHRLSYLNAIAALIDGVEPVRVNFGSLLAEKATAKRVFMVVAQMLKYLDATRPIRFLIAESETGFTLLTALYLAKQFDVEDKVEISPLFETVVGLEHGTRAIAEALSTASFRAYVRRHGRLFVQTGFSDSGRALGQIAAAPCDRAAAHGDRARDGAPGPCRRRAGDLRHARRIDRPRRPSAELRRPARLCRHAGRAPAARRARHHLQAGGLVPGRRRLSLVHRRGRGPGGHDADPGARPRADRRGRRSVLRRGRLRARVLHRGAALQPAHHGRRRLWRSARRLWQQPALSLRLAPDQAPARQLVGPDRPRASEPAARDPAQCRAAADGLPRQRDRRRRRGGRQGPRALPAPVPGTRRAFAA